MWLRFTLFLVFTVGCTKAGTEIQSEDRGEQEVLPTQPAAKQAVGEVSLLSQVDRAEVRRGGETVDFGVPEQAKYIRGGWGTGWGRSAVDGKATYLELSSRKGTLFPFLLEKRRQVSLRVRSAKGKQKISLAVDRRKTPAQEVGTKWTTLVWDLPKPANGRTRIEISHDGKKPIWVDWLWLDPNGSGYPGDSLVDGKSVIATGSRSYSFYQWIEPGSALNFALGASGKGEFAVTVENSRGKKTEIFTHSGAVKGKVAKVSLAKFARDVVRVEFASRDAEPAWWARPRIFAKSKTTQPRKKTAKNLIFILLDTTRADAFPSFTKNSPVKTPVMDAFAKKGRTFLAAYNNGNWTKPSVATILSGLYPETHKALKAASVVPAKVELLSEHLKRQGFYTAAITANFVINEKFGFKKGWDYFKNYSRGKEGNGYFVYRNASNWIRKRDKNKRFFLWVQSVDPHTTYDVPKEYWQPYFSGNYSGVVGPTFDGADQDKVNTKKMRLNETDKKWVQALYKGEVAFQDEQLGVFLKTLKEEGLLDDTIVVITNDHGEEVLDHGLVGHGWSLWEEILRAPLIIHFPPVFGSGVRDPQVVEHVDLAPTLTEVLGVPRMKRQEGVSMLSRLATPVARRSPHYAYSMSNNGKRSVRLGKYKLTVTKKKNWKGLYDLSSSAGETKDLSSRRTLAGRACEIYMAEALASPDKAGRGKLDGGGKGEVAAENADMDPATRAQLEALGYL